MSSLELQERIFQKCSRRRLPGHSQTKAGEEAEPETRNPKSEIRNPKQIRIRGKGKNMETKTEPRRLDFIARLGWIVRLLTSAATKPVTWFFARSRSSMPPAPLRSQRPFCSCLARG